MKRKIKPFRILLIMLFIYNICYCIKLSYQLSYNPDKAAQYEEMMKNDQFKD